MRPWLLCALLLQASSGDRSASLARTAVQLEMSLETEASDHIARQNHSRTNLTKAALNGSTSLHGSARGNKSSSLLGLQVLASSDAQAKAQLGASAALEQQVSFLPGLGMGMNFLKVAGLVAIFAVVFKMMSHCPCGSKKCDCRRIKLIGKALLMIGYDEFEGFETFITVHSVQDVAKEGLMGNKEYKVKISFNWSVFETADTADMRWEQTKNIEVPQGASECVISLYSKGIAMNSLIASLTLETKKHMLDRDGFWGEKQKLKLESKGKNVGTLLVTFRQSKGGDGDADTPGLGPMPISGVSDDSPLAIELMEAMAEMQREPGFVKPEGKLEGDTKLKLLSYILRGNLREISSKGKEMGLVYVKLVYCNFADLQGDDRQEEMERQKRKAKEKGLPDVERKWYWAWYEDKKKAEHDTKWHFPDGFIPLMSVTNIHRSPERSDQFIIKYTEDKEKQVLIYRRDTGKGLDIWVEALELGFQEARKVVKEKKQEQEKEELAMKRLLQMHQQWVKKNGVPKDQLQWTNWFQWLKQNNFEDEQIRKFHQQITVAPKRPK